MLILVAVTVNTAVQSGLFGNAKRATEDWKTKEQEEGNIGNDNQINDIVNEHKYSGGTQKPEGTALKIGDYIDYTPDTAENYMQMTSATTGSSSNPSSGIPQDTTLKWRVMSINEDGTVDMIADRSIATTVNFYGARGFNNGVYLLNDLCAQQYSNSELGVTARSINKKDIEDKFSETGKNIRNEYTSGSGLKYGNSTSFSINNNYTYTPDIYLHTEKTVEGESLSYYDAPTTIEPQEINTLSIKQTYYYIESLESNNFNENDFYNVLCVHAGEQYWVATRFASYINGGAQFGITTMIENSIGGLTLCNMDNAAADGARKVRPVVTLGADIKISETGGTADEPRTLSK